MKRRIRNILKVLFRIVLGVASLIIFLVILFYLFRGKITEKVLDYVNELQPGEVVFNKINLRPFLYFPDVSLQLTEFQFSTGLTGYGMNDTLPVIRMDDIYVSLDLIKLIKGNYKISKVRFGEGEINYIVGADSVSNLERALGIRFDEMSDSDTIQEQSSPILLDLESLQIRDLKINYLDLPGNGALSLRINGLESGFTYYPDLITASVMMHTDIISARYSGINLDKPRSISFSSSLLYDQIHQRITLEKSIMDISVASFEIEGKLDLKEHFVEMKYAASNSGIDLLNFIFNGILDLDAIEQIGDGSIRLDGTISGSFADGIPEIAVNFIAEDMGFRIHAIDDSITSIGFKGSATNGSKKDLSEAEIKVEGFHVSFPQGSLDAVLHIENMIKPSLRLQLRGDAELSILDEFIDKKVTENLSGTVRLAGDFDGIIDPASGKFPDDFGELMIDLNEVGFTIPGYNIERLSGQVYIEDNRTGFREVELGIDSNFFHMEGWAENLLPYFMGYEVDPVFGLNASVEELYIGQLTGDSLAKEPLKNLGFVLGVQMKGDELGQALEGKIPQLNVDLKDFRVQLPGYAPFSEVNLNLRLEKERLVLSNFSGNMGESNFNLSLNTKNYLSFIEKDSSSELTVQFDLEADRILARDLFTFHDEFTTLPVSLKEEEIQNLLVKGKVKTTIGELLNDSILPDFHLLIEEFRWNLKYYPLPFYDFGVDVEYRDSLLLIESFKGRIGENNFLVIASVENPLDSLKFMKGSIELTTDLIDASELMNYALLDEKPSDTVIVESSDTITDQPDVFGSIDFPDLSLILKMQEFRYEGNIFRSINGKILLKPYKIIYLEDFGIQTESGGAISVGGQFNVSDPGLYTLSAAIAIDTLNMTDFNVQLAMEDSLYSLEDNFNGILSADGIAEFFINPDFSIDIDNSTAMFNLSLADGRVRNFAPLQAVGRFTGSKDLDNVQFGLLRNSFTLMDGLVQIPLMSIESTLGLILLEGEQGLGGDFLYLVRVPTRLIRGTAWNMLSNQQRKEGEEEDEIEEMESQKFARITVVGIGEEVEVKMGDKRDNYR
jgi:hypothetical protein